MNLKTTLRQAGYDLIEAPIRNHKPLQLWLKKPSRPIELYYEHLSHALDSNLPLGIEEDAGLSVDYSKSQSYKFNIGITVLEQLLTSMGLGNLSFGLKLNGGKKVSISYNSSKTLTVPTGPLSDYMADSDFRHANPEFLRNANHDNIHVISGVLMAKDIMAEIETTSDIDANVAVEFAEMVDGKLDFTLANEKKLVIKSEGNALFPVAVKANRLDWDKGEYDKMTLITGNRFFF
ncbi:MAG: hypothetical protein ACI9FU_002493 [Granulosicoccus sp.]|jgi:hypothetical protein